VNRTSAWARGLGSSFPAAPPDVEASVEERRGGGLRRNRLSRGTDPPVQMFRALRVKGFGAIDHFVGLGCRVEGV